MNDKDFFTVAGYFANPIRRSLIEVEIPNHMQAGFESKYKLLTGGISLPLATNVAPYYVWPIGTDKRGRQFRLYFVSGNPAPALIANLLEPKNINTRPGYQNYNRRFNSVEIIERLFQYGYVVGSPQDQHRIRAMIPAKHLADFNIGFAL